MKEETKDIAWYRKMTAAIEQNCNEASKISCDHMIQTFTFVGIYLYPLDFKGHLMKQQQIFLPYKLLRIKNRQK